MLSDHDFKRFPELSNTQIQVDGFNSPHKQITEDFMASVVRVVDGDTIVVNCDFRDFDFPIRLLDIDALELSEGGREAKEWLQDRIEGDDIQVLIDKTNRVGKYGRLLGRIFHRGMNVAQEMLHLGLVFPFGSKLEGEVPDLNFYFKRWV